jgi:NDP-sugar pyrophosphorylase family protein
VLAYLAGQGIREAVVSAGYLPRQMQAFCRSQNVLPEVRCAVEPKPMGTAGGFLWASQACAMRPEAWLVLNGDSLACAPLADFCACLRGADAAVLAVWQDDASRYGTLQIGEGLVLQSFQEKRPGSGWINAGVYLFPDSILPQFPSPRPLSFETEVFPSLLDQGVIVRVHQVRAPFLDIGTPESLIQAEAFVRGNQSWFSSQAESA